MENQQNCEHFPELKTSIPSVLKAKIGTAQTRAQSKLQEYLQNRLKRGVNEKTYCPECIDCHLCFCIDCEYQVCLSSTPKPKNHFIETGHSIGYESCGSLYCFKCDKSIHVLIEPKPDNRNVDNILVIRRTSHLERKRRKVEMDHIVCCRGLYNFGITCFINCVIQVLIHTSEISNFFFQNKRKLSLRKYFSSSQKELSFIEVFQELLIEFQKSESKPLVPSRLLYVILLKMPHFFGNRQHDAHEFFISTLNVIHQEFLRAKDTDTIIDQTFLGRLQSKVTCNVCSHSRYIDDPFFDIALEVITEKPKDVPIELRDLLQQFTRLEDLDDSNLLHCTICNRKTKSTKQLSFKVLPSVFCLQLKRFCRNPQSKSDFIKISTKLSIPECVDFSSYTTANIYKQEQESFCEREENCDKYNYKLYGIVSHIGKSLSTGHYRTYIRKSQDWLLFDDQTVKKVSSAIALECEGYLLFYKRCQNL